MKKTLLSIAVFAVMMMGAMTVSAFTNPSNAVVSEYEYTLASDEWKLFRENVPYCDGDKGICEGSGWVWVNTDTYQVAFSITYSGTKYDLSEYTSKDGYNMRFWYKGAYHYVNIYVPRSL